MKKDEIIDQLSQEDKEIIEQYKKSLLDSHSRISSTSPGKYGSGIISGEMPSVSVEPKSWDSKKSSPSDDFKPQKQENQLNAIVFNSSTDFQKSSPTQEYTNTNDLNYQNSLKNTQNPIQKPRLVVPTFEELESKEKQIILQNNDNFKNHELMPISMKITQNASNPINFDNSDKFQESEKSKNQSLTKNENILANESELQNENNIQNEIEPKRSTRKSSPKNKEIRKSKSPEKPDYSEFSGDFRILLENKYNAYLKRTQKQNEQIAEPQITAPIPIKPQQIIRIFFIFVKLKKKRIP